MRFFTKQNFTVVLILSLLIIFSFCKKNDGNGSGTISANVNNVRVNCYTPFTRQMGVSGDNTYGYGIATDSNGGVYVTGETNGGLDGNTLTGDWDVFVTNKLRE